MKKIDAECWAKGPPSPNVMQRVPQHMDTKGVSVSAACSSGI